MWSTRFALLSVLLRLVGASINPSCPDTSQAAYDYVVVGAGAGGGPLAARLAEHGYSVLVVDAGHDVRNVNTTIPLYFGRATEDPAIELAYTLDEYPPGFPYQKDNVWYPRARGIGGSTIHNALINIIAASRPDFDGLASMFNDSSFSRENMQKYYTKLEHALYPALNADHGFQGWLEANVNPLLTLLKQKFLDFDGSASMFSDSSFSHQIVQKYYKKLEHALYPVLNTDHGLQGWLKTNPNPILTLLKPKFLDSQLLDLTASTVASDLPVIDLNSLAGDDAAGVNLPTFTKDENYDRTSARDRLVSVQQSSAGKLQFSLDTLATRILLCNNTDGSLLAYGVEIAEGASLPVAGNFQGKADLKLRNVIVKREVIVSAGTFQSPQLLMLSGIGDREELNAHGIDTAVHLPGVGKNLQDHDEIAVMWQMKSNFSLLSDCTFKYTHEEDPCLAYRADVSKLSPYSLGIPFAVTTKSRPEYKEPDMLTYIAPIYFPGFIRGFSQKIADCHNIVTMISLKAHASSKGFVQLTGSHPQDPLRIQKMQFQAENGKRDVEDLRESIKKSRKIMSSLPVALHVDKEIFPGPEAETDEQIEKHIYENVFGHHICCTNPMGIRDDPNAVLDAEFQVYGVSNLRIVDASIFPNVPGYFVTTLIYMMSEKAADSILAKARA